jgi:amidohydrolase
MEPLFKKVFPKVGMLSVIVSFAIAFPVVSWAQSSSGSLQKEIERFAKEVEPKVIEWRRDIHQNPELGNREFRTSKLVAEHLHSLGMEVKTNIAHTGVVGILRGQKDTPVVALRADMDALPVTELVDVPFASKVKTTYMGQEVGVMHACGHDAHTAGLMGVAVVLSKLKDKLPGTVKFIFQPAEEGSPPGEQGGAWLMVKEGVLESPKPGAIFGLHVGAGPVGTISYREGGAMASADSFTIKVKGSQTHGAMPWMGVDPIVVSSQIVLGLQTIVSRQTNLTATPAVISVGKISGGVRFNIIPAEVEMVGTIRVFDTTIRKAIHEKIGKTAKMIAESAGATAEVTIPPSGVPVTYNDPKLTRQMESTFHRIVGKDKVLPALQRTGAEDFSFYQEKVPGLFFFLGITPPGGKEIPNHSPHFYIDESALGVGVQALSNVAVDYLESQK